MNISAEEKNRYLREAEVVLAREGFLTDRTHAGTDIPATSSAEDRALAYAEGQHKSLVLLHPTELTTKQISAAHDAR